MSKDLARRIETARTQMSRLSSDRARAEGALLERMKTLEKEFGCDSLAKAEVLLKKKQRSVQKAKEKLEDAVFGIEKELEKCEV